MASYFGYAGKMGQRTQWGPNALGGRRLLGGPSTLWGPRTLGLRTLRGPGSYEDLGPCEDLEFFDDPGKT